MKKLLLSLATILITSGLYAQGNVMNKGDIMMNIGLGLGYPSYSDYSYGNNFGFGVMPSLNVSGEVGLFPTGKFGIVTLGGVVSAGSARYYGTFYDGKAFSTDVLFRGAWHLSIWNNTSWDVYAGLGSGIRFNSVSFTTIAGNTNLADSKGTNFIISEFVGARYMMNESFGFFGELSFGEVSFTKVGITFKF